jgi:hypothetical protein
MAPWSSKMLRPQRRRQAAFPASDTLRAWFDFHDRSALFQDAAGMVEVASVGDPLGRVVNKALGRAPLTVGSAWSRPTWQPFGDGRHGGQFDGADDYLRADDPDDWTFLHDGRGAVVFVSLLLQGAFDGPIVYNAGGDFGMILHVGYAPSGSYVSAIVNSGVSGVGEPAWLATTPDEYALKIGRNVVGCAFRRDGTTNSTRVWTNGAERAGEVRELATVFDGPAAGLYVQPWSTPNVTIGEVLIYETAAMFEAAAQIESFLST